MKYFLIPIILLITSCATVSTVPIKVEITGNVLGSYVSTSSGLVKGNILHISDRGSISKVQAVVNNSNVDPRKVLLTHNNSDLLSDFAGKQVIVSGVLRSEQIDIFHTNFILAVDKIIEVKTATQ